MSKESQNPRILVVDDEPGWRDLLSFELISQGYEVVTASNASEGIAVLRSQVFNLVVTDVRMPGQMDGIDLIETYRKENPNQKALFITGYATEEKLSNSLQNRHSSCIRKPFHLDELSKAISELLHDLKSAE